MNVFNESNDKYSQYPILLELKHELELTNHARRTIMNYVDLVFRFLEFSNVKDPFSLNEDHFRQFLIYLKQSGLNPKSINAYNSHIRFFYQAVLDIPLNLRRIPMMIARPKDIDFLSPDKIISLLDCSKADSRADCIIKLGLCCGMRINEVISLKVSDIDIPNMRIFICQSKRNKSRFVPIDKTMYLALHRYSREYHLKKDDYLFTFTHLKVRTNNETIRRHFYFYRDLANIPDSVTFHCLRHTFAVNYINAGGDLLHLSYLMGHNSTATTNKYLHIAYTQKMQIPSFMDSLLEVSDNG